MKTIKNKINVICLGVRNMEKSILFYRDELGLRTNEKEYSPKAIFFNISGTKFELYPLELLCRILMKLILPKSGKDSEVLLWLIM
ncbi:MAG: VOC family protein [Tannerellaceae bacterium]|jgi:catechol 2,3-dioxygenase-like lactoylglutathione lyase family enzyme|nr:VOC family protein [Tannerellaceae bacterium]